MITVTHDEVKRAFWNWYDASNSTYGQAVREFYALTGITSFLSSEHRLDEAQARRIRLMAGPHGKTLILAHCAKEAANDPT